MRQSTIKLFHFKFFNFLHASTLYLNCTQLMTTLSTPDRHIKIAVNFISILIWFVLGPTSRVIRIIFFIKLVATYSCQVVTCESNFSRIDLFNVWMNVQSIEINLLSSQSSQYFKPLSNLMLNNDKRVLSKKFSPVNSDHPTYSVV